MCQQEICPSNAYICQLLHVHISDYYVNIYASYELTAINNVTQSTGIHAFYITGTCH